MLFNGFLAGLIGQYWRVVDLLGRLELLFADELIEVGTAPEDNCADFVRGRGVEGIGVRGDGAFEGDEVVRVGWLFPDNLLSSPLVVIVPVGELVRGSVGVCERGVRWGSYNVAIHVQFCDCEIPYLAVNFKEIPSFSKRVSGEKRTEWMVFWSDSGRSLFLIIEVCADSRE